MFTRKRAIPLACSAVALIALTGCQTPIVHGINSITMAGGLDEQMRDRNIAGMVAFDEVWAGNYNLANRNNLYTQGAVSGTPEYGLRIARINMRHTDYFAWIRQGEKIWIAVGIVPDHIPQLKARDIVELRQTGGTRTVENFATTGEGNIVVRVLCRAADPAYDAA